MATVALLWLEQISKQQAYQPHLHLL